MSGEGSVMVRCPKSVLGAFRASARLLGLTVDDWGRNLIELLPSLDEDELMSLPDPPREQESSHITLWVGWNAVDTLASITRRSNLTNSTILRRVFYAPHVTGEIVLVQDGENRQIKYVMAKLNSGARYFTGTKRTFGC